MKEKKLRIAWVDIFKGISIVLIVIGHTWSPLNRFIYLFHVPIFFMISGWTSNFSKYDFPTYLFKKINQLLVPYFFFNLAFIFIHTLLKKISLDYLFYTEAERIKYATFTSINWLLSTTATESIGGATWFLIAIFFSSIFSFFITKKLLDKEKSFFLPVLVGLIIVAYSFFSRKWFVTYLLDLAFLATFFVLLGRYLKEVLTKLNLYVISFFASTAILSIFYFGAYRSVPLDFPSRSFASPILITITSVFGFILVYYTSLIFEKIKILSSLFEYLGRKSLWILALHFLAIKFFHLFGFFLGYFSLSHVQELVPPPGNNYWLLVSIFAIIIPLCVEKLFYYLIKIVRTIDKSKLLKVLEKNITQILILTSITLICQKWMLDANHFFYADDFGYLNLSNILKPINFLRIIPNQMYNDRTFGQMIIYYILRFFEDSYRLIHLNLLLIHILNSWLVFIFVKQIKKFFSIEIEGLALSTGLIFANWPKSIMAAQWLSAVFDLVGGTLVLIFLNLFLFTQSKNKYLALIYNFVYLLMLRSKEVLLLAPLILFVFLKTRGKKIKSLSIFLWINFLLMIWYGGSLVYLAVTSRVMGYSGESPYAISLNPFLLVKNLIKYFVLYFDLYNTSQTFASLTKVGFIFLLLIGSFMVISIFKSSYKKEIISFFLSATLFLIPVLPLKNMSHRLYLYIPSIFLALGLAIMYLETMQRYRYKKNILLFFLMTSLLYLNLKFPYTVIERNWWLDVGLLNKSEYENLKEMKKNYPDVNKFLILIPNNTSIYHFGPGDIIKYVYNSQDLEILFANPDKAQEDDGGEMKKIMLID